MIMQKYVARDEYLDFLKRHQDKKVIKVVSGLEDQVSLHSFYFFVSI